MASVYQKKLKDTTKMFYPAGIVNLTAMTRIYTKLSSLEVQFSAMKLYPGELLSANFQIDDSSFVDIRLR